MKQRNRLLVLLVLIGFGLSIFSFHSSPGFMASVDTNQYVPQPTVNLRQNQTVYDQFIYTNEVDLAGVGHNSTHIFATFDSSDGGHVVKIYDFNENFITQFGGSGTSDGQFSQPTDVFVTPNYIFVNDLGNNRIQQFAHNLTHLNTINSTTSPSTGIGSVHRIANNGTHLLVPDITNNEVHVYTIDNGTYIDSFGSSGTGLGQFDLLIDVTANETHFFIGDLYQDHIEVFDSQFNPVLQINSSAPLQTSEIDHTGNHLIYGDRTSDDQLRVINYQGETINVYDRPFGYKRFSVSNDILITNKRDVAITINHHQNGIITDLTQSSSMVNNGTNYFVADSSGDQILIYDYDFTQVGRFGTEGSDSLQFLGIQDIHYDPDDQYLYVADTGNDRVSIYTTDGNLIRNFGSTNLSAPQSLTTNETHVFVADSSIKVYLKNGTLVDDITFDSLGYTSTPSPDGIFIYRDHLYMIDNTNNQIIKFSYTGNHLGEDSYTLNVVDADLKGPHLYLSDSSGDQIIVIDMITKEVDGTIPTPIERTSYPASISVTENGRILIADDFNRNVYEFFTFFSAPQNLTATFVNNSVQLNWDLEPDTSLAESDFYYIYRTQNSSLPGDAARIDATNYLNYTDVGISATGNYTYFVTGIKPNGSQTFYGKVKIQISELVDEFTTTTTTKTVTEDGNETTITKTVTEDGNDTTKTTTVVNTSIPTNINTTDDVGLNPLIYSTLLFGSLMVMVLLRGKRHK